jgi:hypothetical protein
MTTVMKVVGVGDKRSNHEASLEITQLLRNTKIHYRVQESPLLTTSQMHILHTSRLCICL